MVSQLAAGVTKPTPVPRQAPTRLLPEMLLLLQVEAVHQARLEAQQYCYQLRQAHNELEELRQQVVALHGQQQQQQRQQRLQQHDRLPAAVEEAAGLEEQLQEARLEAADHKLAKQLAELELAKQLDALQELQWQLSCVVAQLGLGPNGSQGGAPCGGGTGSSDWAAAPPDAAAVPASDKVDHMLLLSKVEELRMAQLELQEYKRRLAFAEAQLAAAAQQEQEARQQRGPGASSTGAQPGPGTAVPVHQESRSGEWGSGGGGISLVPPQLGAGGRQLVGELVHENEQLRRRLAEAEVRCRVPAAQYLGHAATELSKVTYHGTACARQAAMKLASGCFSAIISVFLSICCMAHAGELQQPGTGL